MTMQQRLYQIHQRILQVKNLRVLAKQRGLSLHRTNAGWLIRRDGRIVKQSFSIQEVERHLREFY